MLSALKKGIQSVGKLAWRPLLEYLVKLHAAGIHPGLQQLQALWEEVCLNTSPRVIQFGHWNTVHIALDTLFYELEHGINQIFNLFSLQQPDGAIPGHIFLVDGRLKWAKNLTSPPLWPYVARQYLKNGGDKMHRERFMKTAMAQIHWLEEHRKSSYGGFYYLDMTDCICESGLEGSPRFNLKNHWVEDPSCIDASCHVYGLFEAIVDWGKELDINVGAWQEKKEALKAFIQEKLFCEKSGLFVDAWQVAEPEEVIVSFDFIWSLVFKIATVDQAKKIVEGYILNSSFFYTEFPLATLSVQDFRYTGSRFCGGVYNFINYWCAIGLMQYGYDRIARKLLEKSIDKTLEVFRSTGTIWEYYSPIEGRTWTPLLRDHLGHNPVIAMAVLWQELVDRGN